MVSVTKRFTFEAAHHLPYYDGLCHSLHGHSYLLEVTVSGETKNYGCQQGMIIDFKELKRIIEYGIVSKYDHKDLNLYFENPTAEIMVESMGKEIETLLGELQLESVKLWETSDSYAEYRPRR